MSTTPRTVTLHLGPEMQHLLADLQVRTGAPTMADVWRLAVALLDSLSAADARGAELVVRYPDGAERAVLIRDFFYQEGSPHAGPDL